MVCFLFIIILTRSSKTLHKVYKWNFFVNWDELQWSCILHPNSYLHVTLLTKAYLVSLNEPHFPLIPQEIHNGGNPHYSDCNIVNYSF